MTVDKNDPRWAATWAHFLERTREANRIAAPLFAKQQAALAQEEDVRLGEPEVKEPEVKEEPQEGAQGEEEIKEPGDLPENYTWDDVVKWLGH